MNVITTWCLLIPLSYLTAFVLGWGYIGIILINIFEEGVRFILIIRRWDKGTLENETSTDGSSFACIRNRDLK